MKHLKTIGLVILLCIAAWHFHLMPAQGFSGTAAGGIGTITSPISITGTANNGTDKVSGVIVNGVIDASSFGVVCDDSTDDTSNINAALSAAAASCGYTHNYADHTIRVTLPGNTSNGAGVVCKTLSTISLNASCVMLDGQGATIDAAHQSSSAKVITAGRGSQSGTQPYGNTTTGIENLHINGPGGASSEGISLNGISGAIFRNIDIYNVATGIKVDASNTFVDKFSNIDISNFSVAGFYCPGGFSNTGEMMRFDNIDIYNSGSTGGVGIINEGCEVDIDRISIDFVNDSAIKTATSTAADYTASTKVVNFHIERSGANQITTDPVLDIGGGSGKSGGSAWSNLQMSHGQILNDDGRTVSIPTAASANGTTATFTVTSITGFTTGDNIGVNGCSDSAWNGIQGPITASGTSITFSTTLTTSPTGCQIGDKPDALALVRNNAFADHSASNGFGTPTGAWASLTDFQVVGWAFGGPCTTYNPVDISASCVLGNNDSKVSLARGASGWGGGQALAVGVGPLPTGITGTTANCLYADANGLVHGLGSACGSASPTVYSAVSGNFTGNLTGSALSAVIKAPAAGHVTDISVQFGTAPVGCTQFPVFVVGDCGSTLTTGGTACNTTTLCTFTTAATNKLQHVSCTSGNTFSSGDFLELVLPTPESGCSANGANANVTFQFGVP